MRKVVFLLLIGLWFGARMPNVQAQTVSTSASHGNLIYEGNRGNVALYAADIHLLEEKISTIPEQCFDPVCYARPLIYEAVNGVNYADRYASNTTLYCQGCEEPDEPDTSWTEDASEEPDEAETEDSPEEPETPDSSGTGDAPEEPETPDPPETEDAPDEPETPDSPETGDAPEEPEAPDPPGTGDAPEEPEAPDPSGTEDAPEEAETPDPPGTEDAPAADHMRVDHYNIKTEGGS